MNFRSAEDSDNDDSSVQSRSPVPSLPRGNNTNNNNNNQNNNAPVLPLYGAGSHYSSTSSVGGVSSSPQNHHQQQQQQQQQQNLLQQSQFQTSNNNASSTSSIFGNLLSNIPNSWSILELLNLGGSASTNNTIATNGLLMTTTTSNSQNGLSRTNTTMSATTTTTTSKMTNNQQQQQAQEKSSKPISSEISIVVRHFTGDFRQFSVPHGDFSIGEVKEAYIATLIKQFPPKELQEFLAHAQTQAEYFRRRRPYFTASPNNIAAINNNNNNAALNNNNNSFAMNSSGYSPYDNSNNNRIVSGGYNSPASPLNAPPGVAANGGGGTRFSGVLGKNFSNFKLNAYDLTFAGRDGHILQDCEKISSLKKVDSVQSYLELYVVPLLLHRREEPLLVVSPLFPLPTNSTSTSNSSSNTNNNNTNASPFPTCGGAPILIREYDFSDCILDVNSYNDGEASPTQQQEHATPDDKTEIKFATTTLSQMNSSNSLSQENVTQQKDTSSISSPTSTKGENNNNNNQKESDSFSTTTGVHSSSHQNQNATLRELTIREVAISSADLARKRASGLGGAGGGEGENNNSKSGNNNNNTKNPAVDCGDFIVHVHPTSSHALVLEHNSANVPSTTNSKLHHTSNNNSTSNQQKSVQVKCVDHFCKFISVHHNNVQNSSNQNAKSKNTTGGGGVASPSQKSASSSPYRGGTHNTNTNKPPLSNTSAASLKGSSSPTSVAGAANNNLPSTIGLPPLAAATNNSNNLQQQQQQNNNNTSSNQIFPIDRPLSYFSSQKWSPVHAWVSPDGNFVIVHIVEKEATTSTSFGGLPLHINNPFSNGVSSTKHRHNHPHRNQNQQQSKPNNNNSNDKNKNNSSSNDGSNTNNSTVFLVFESAARGSSWLCRGAFRLPFEHISISGWACENRFVLCVGLTHCVVRVEVEGDVSIQCSTLVKKSMTKNNNASDDSSGVNSSFVPSASSLQNQSSNNNNNSPSPSSSRFAPPLQIVRTLHTYLDGTLMWYDPKRSLLKICHPASSLASAMKLLEQNLINNHQHLSSSSTNSFGNSSSPLVTKEDPNQVGNLNASPIPSKIVLTSSQSSSSVHSVATMSTAATASSVISSNPIIQSMEHHLSSVGFAIHFKRRINHSQAQNYNFLLQSRPPQWQQHHQQLLSSALPRLVLSPGDDGRFQGFCSVSNESSIIGNNNNNNNSSSSMPTLPIPLSTTKATPQAIYFLHKMNPMETAPDPPNEAFLAMFPRYLIYVSEHAIIPSLVMMNNNNNNNPNSPSNNKSSKDSSSSASANSNNNSSTCGVLREDRFVTSYVYPPILPGNVVCCQYAKPTTQNGFARLRVVYCHDDETTGETTLHVVVLQAEWKDTKNLSNSLNFVHLTSQNNNNNNNDPQNNTSNNNNSANSNNGNKSKTDTNNNNNNASSSNSSGGGLFDYLKKKISVWRGNSDDVLAANASKEAERIALATHKQIKFTSSSSSSSTSDDDSSSLSAFRHGACDCFMAAAAPVGLIVKATGSGGGVAVVRVRSALYGS